MNKRWLVKRTNRDFLGYLSRKNSISTILAQILVNRGIKDVQSIEDFLTPSLNTLHDPFLLPDVEKAVDRINTALEKKETVLVYGDYDADGLTATALLVSVLQRIGIQTLHYHIPNRITEGYGLSRKGIQKAQALGATLLITADCGVSSEEEVSLARNLGIDVIITDHHEPPRKLPDAAAIINPHRTDSTYPFRYLAGVGVAFKLCQALLNSSRRAREIPDLENFLDLVAIGTIADSVPLTGENRVLTIYGLRALNSQELKPCFQALKEISGIQKRILDSILLSYTIIPRINAVGRLGDSRRVVDFFLTQDEAKARELASFIENQNKKRQQIEESVLHSVLKVLDPAHMDPAIVLSSAEWHPGVIGIVSSRLVDAFYRPVFLFSVQDGVAKGSARSIPPFHIHKGISECSGLLLGYGGHSQAAGLSIAVENLPAFREQMNTIVENILNEEERIPTLEIDAGVDLSDVNFSLVRELNRLEPFGNGNKRPVLGTKEVEIIEPRTVGNNHLKAKSKQKSVTIETIGFSMAQSIEEIEDSLTIDIAFTPCINEWNGKRSLQLNLKDLKPSN